MIAWMMHAALVLAMRYLFVCIAGNVCMVYREPESETPWLARRVRQETVALSR